MALGRCSGIAVALSIATLALSLGPATAAAQEPPPAAPPELIIPPYFPVNVGIIHPLAANAAVPDLWTNFDLAVILGRVGFVDGVQIGPGAWTGYQLRGVQIGVASVVGARAEGIQLGGAFTFVDGPLEGLQLAGVLGWASGTLHGLQLAGAGNQIYGDLVGMQVAGGVNVARQLVTGAQISGLGNIGRVDGLQVAAVNVSAGQRGIQVGGLNVSRSQKGLQIGIVNVARRIDGLQVGVVNITDNLDGESLGIIPIPRRGGIHLALWGSTSLLGNAGIRFASRYAYSLISVGFHGDEREDGTGREVFYAAGLALGARAMTGVQDLSVAADIGVSRLFREGLTFNKTDEIYKLRVMAGYSLAPRMTPFLGGGVYLKARGDDAIDFRFGPEVFVGLEL